MKQKIERGKGQKKVGKEGKKGQEHLINQTPLTNKNDTEMKGPLYN